MFQFRFFKILLNAACIANAFLFMYILYENGDQLCNSIAKMGEFSTHVLYFAIDFLLLYRIFLVYGVRDKKPLEQVCIKH